MAKIEQRDGAYKVCGENEKEFNVWFSQDGGGLIVTMAEEIQGFDDDRLRWMEELRNSPTMWMKLSEVEGKLVFEKFTVDCRKEGRVVTGLIEINRESGVWDVRIEAKSPRGGRVTIWHEGEVKKGYSFWGIFAGMPLPGWNGYDSHLPTVAIRPGMSPKRMIYWAPSVEGDVSFTDGWETDMIPVDLGFSGETNSTNTFKHRAGFEEVVKVKRISRAGKMRMEMERRVCGLPDELSGESFFAPTHLRIEFPVVFPKSLVEVTGVEVGEELAGELIYKMVELRALLDGIFPNLPLT